VLQLEKVSRALLADLARRAPLLPGRDTVAFVDMDSMQKRVYGRQKQGAAFGQTKIQWKACWARAALPRETRPFETRGSPAPRSQDP
jgi:hypothetical protein